MFRISKDVDTWFKNIKNHFKLDFDIYYMCLVIGLSAGLKQSLSGTDVKDIYKDFPQEYGKEKQIIFALFLRREVEKFGVDLEDKKGIHDVIQQYTDVALGAGINQEAHRVMNEYANSGFQILKEEFEERPQTIEAFLIKYDEVVKKLNLERRERNL